MQTPQEHISNQVLIMFGKIHAEWLAFDKGGDALTILGNIKNISNETFEDIQGKLND